MIIMIAAGLAGSALPQAAPVSPAMDRMAMPASPSQGSPAPEAKKDCCAKMAAGKEGCECCKGMNEHKDGHAAH